MSQRFCRFIEKCPMYPEFVSKTMLRVYQIQFCEGAFESCERFRSASAGVMPSPTLLPDGSRLRGRSRKPGAR